MSQAMEEPSELFDAEDKQLVFNALFDPFVEYFHPEIIFQHNPWFSEHRDEFLQDSSLTSSDITPKDFFTWIQDDESSVAIQQFEVALRQFISYHENSAAATSAAATVAADKESAQLVFVKLVIKLLDGSLVKDISKSDLVTILELMLVEKMITKKCCDQVKEKRNPQKACMKMLKNITRGKSNWPLVFFSSVSKVRPDLVHPESIGSIQSGTISIFVQCVAKHNTPNIQMADNSKDGSMEKSESPQLLLDQLSDFTNSFVNEDFMFKIRMTEEERSSVFVQRWLATENFDRNSIVSEELYQEWLAKHPVHSERDMSDDEDDDKKEKFPGLKPRKYQIELAEDALRGQNAIVWAPTGSGKTRVAIHIILNHLQQQDDTRKRKVAFFARTVPLVMQQYRCLLRFMPEKFKVTHMTGNMAYMTRNNNNCLQMDKIIQENDVIVMTPRMLENHFRNTQDHVDIFSMLVFDECHHTRKGEPYNTLMHLYLKRKEQISEMQRRGDETDIKLPQIVGLTASISVEDATNDQEAADNILQVCGNLDVYKISCVEENIDELREKVPKSEEELQQINERVTDDAVYKIVEKMLEFEKKIAELAEKLENEKIKQLLESIPPNRKSLQYGHWTVKVQNVAKSLPRKSHQEVNGWKRSLIILTDYLATYNVALELHDLVLLRDVVAFLEKCFHKYKQNRHCTEDENTYFESFSELSETMAEKLDAVNPNLTVLKDCLLNHLVQKGETSLGIIFVRTRALTSAITSWLRKCGDKAIESLNAIAFTGTAATAADGGMTVAKQKEAINMLRNGQSRLMVATSVAEEGIDIPECNLVVKYNYVGNEITTVQTRGRSRKKGGRSVILAMPKIIDKEKENQRKAEMMENGVKLIRKMETSQVQEKIGAHQRKILAEEERSEMEKRILNGQLLKQPFKMVCHGCGDLAIDSKDIRTIYHVHHVVVNSEIFYRTRTLVDSKPSYFDNIHIIGPVHCRGNLGGQTHCNTKIGTLMIFSNVPYVVLGVKGLGFELPEKQELFNFKKWKAVPFLINEIDCQDFESYLPDEKMLQHNTDDNPDDITRNPSQTAAAFNIPKHRVRFTEPGELPARTAQKSGNGTRIPPTIIQNQRKAQKRQAPMTPLSREPKTPHSYEPRTSCEPSHLTVVTAISELNVSTDVTAIQVCLNSPPSLSSKISSIGTLPAKMSDDAGSLKKSETSDSELDLDD